MIKYTQTETEFDIFITAERDDKKVYATLSKAKYMDYCSDININQIYLPIDPITEIHKILEHELNNMKRIELTPEELVALIFNESNKYILLEKILFEKHEGAYAYEYTYDYIFKLKDLEDYYILRAEIGDEDNDDDEWKMNFIDYCEMYNINSFEANKGTWNNQPRFIIDK